MKKKMRLSLGLLIVVFLVALLLRNDKVDPDMENFAKYLSEQGISMAGTEWCTHCKAQKELFGESFKYVDYHNCDLDKQWCADHGVNAYPTWVFPDANYPGGKSIKQLKEMSNYG
nr:hypothetical protein [Nanoarchaeum sp.]